MFTLAEKFCGALPAALVEHYKKADGAAVRVALLFLAEKSADIDTICRELQMDRSSAEAAVDFWQKAGLLTGCTEGASQPYTMERMARSALKNPEISQLFSEAQRILGRPTSHSENLALAEMYEVGGFTAEYILFVLEYSRGFARRGGEVSYAASVAREWQKAGISSLSDAERHLGELEAQRKMIDDVAAALGITDQKINKREAGMIISWSEKLGYGAEFAAEAAKQSGKSEIPYINAILISWHDKGIKSIRQTRSGLSNAPAGSRKAANKDSLFDSVMNQYKENK